MFSEAKPWLLDDGWLVGSFAGERVFVRDGAVVVVGDVCFCDVMSAVVFLLAWKNNTIQGRGEAVEGFSVGCGERLEEKLEKGESVGSRHVTSHKNSAREKGLQ